MTNESIPLISHNALVLIGDGQKALFLRNKGTAHQVRLEVEQVLEQDNPATREQGTDRPGRSVSTVGTARSAVEEVDWHHIAKERFAGEIAAALYLHAHDNRFDSSSYRAGELLGNLRKAFHAEVTDKIVGEISKDFASVRRSKSWWRPSRIGWAVVLGARPSLITGPGLNSASELVSFSARPRSSGAHTSSMRLGDCSRHPQFIAGRCCRRQRR